jgi:3-carboxy-cis,cis-muconate cycloisomerase
MSLYSHLFYFSKHKEFSDESADLSRMLLFESSLAQSQAKCGIIPQAAADMIAACAQIEFLDIDKLTADIRLGGNAAIPLVQQLTRIVKNNDVEASRYVHVGATSQDVIDTATVLEIKAYIIFIEQTIETLGKELYRLIKKHASTVMMGRTLLQQAKPITFGLKLAAYLEALMRHQERLQQLKSRVLSLQLSGAVGAGNAFISNEVAEHLASSLGLNVSSSWQTNRDSMVEWAGYLANLTGFCGKIATDISLLMQTEIAEVFEGAAEGKGGSSTMPHKRNPVTCAAILANAARTPHLAATMYAVMSQENERSAGKWHAEWDTLKELHLLSAGALEKCLDLMQHLEVDAERMLQNVELTKGLIYAENVSLALAKTMGKLNAHEWVEKACKQAIKSGLHLMEVCKQLNIEVENLESLFDPKQSIGNSIEIIQVIVQKYENTL